MPRSARAAGTADGQALRGQEFMRQYFLTALIALVAGFAGRRSGPLPGWAIRRRAAISSPIRTFCRKWPKPSRRSRPRIGWLAWRTKSPNLPRRSARQSRRHAHAGQVHRLRLHILQGERARHRPADRRGSTSEGGGARMADLRGQRRGRAHGARRGEGQHPAFYKAMFALGPPTPRR